jgi:hypothetical protein
MYMYMTHLKCLNYKVSKLKLMNIFRLQYYKITNYTHSTVEFFLMELHSNISEHYQSEYYSSRLQLDLLGVHPGTYHIS